MTVESIADFYEGTDFGQEIRARGRVQGREEGREEALAHLLRARFGDRPELPGIAAGLARQADFGAALGLAASASLRDLLDV